MSGTKTNRGVKEAHIKSLIKVLSEPNRPSITLGRHDIVFLIKLLEEAQV